MTNYVIIAPPSSTLSDQIVGGHFPEHMSIVPGSVWAVGTTLGTCADVRDRLGANPDPGTDRPTCVVVKALEYNGYARLRAVELDVREIKTDLKHVATRAWVLGGVLAAAGVGAGIVVAVLRFFTN